MADMHTKEIFDITHYHGNAHEQRLTMLSVVEVVENN